MKIKIFIALLFLLYLSNINFSFAKIGANHSQSDVRKCVENEFDNKDLKKRVLVLNAYHEGFHWTDKIMRGINSIFSQDENIELFVNYMDTKRCSDSIYFQQLKNLYSHKYSQVKFDAIISTDDHALDFLLNFRDTLFPEVPVVFCGINDYKPTRIENHNIFTGVYESYDIEGTVNLILKLHPQTSEIAVISDGTLSGNAFNNRFKRIEDDLKEVVNFKFITNLPPSEISQQLQFISKTTVVIWSIYIRKPDGGVLTSKESIGFVTSNTSQPVYCVWDVVGQGVVGGKITDPVYQGKRSAEMVMKIFNGVKISEIPVEGSPLVYKFDFNLLEKFSISESILPEKSIIVNHSFSFYQIHRGKIIGIFFLILFLVGVVIVLMYLIQKQRQAKAEIFTKNIHLEEAGQKLKKSNAELIKALEIAKKSKELEIANEKLLENEKTQKRLNDELKISNITKDKFFAIIAHDLRSPFNSICGIALILKENFEKLKIEEQKEFLASLDSTVQNTFKLLENLLLWSQAQTGDIDFKPEKLNLHLLVNETNELFNQSIKNKSISLSNQITDNVFVDADREMLLSIIRNLLSNAIKFTPRGGNVIIKDNMVTSKDNREHIAVSVIDNGVGIPKEVQSKLFDISENTSTNGTEKETGTGLGLLLCHEFVVKNKGSLNVKSEVGKGSEFIFTIPCSKLD